MGRYAFLWRDVFGSVDFEKHDLGTVKASTKGSAASFPALFAALHVLLDALPGKHAKMIDSVQVQFVLDTCVDQWVHQASAVRLQACSKQLTRSCEALVQRLPSLRCVYVQISHLGGFGRANVCCYSNTLKMCLISITSHVFFCCRKLLVLAPEHFLEDDDQATARLVEAAKNATVGVRVALAVATVGSSRWASVLWTCAAAAVYDESVNTQTWFPDRRAPHELWGCLPVSVVAKIADLVASLNRECWEYAWCRY